MNKKTILLIDDEEKIRQFVRISMQAEGFHCVEAARADEGLVLFAEENPHLIILDLGLPDMDGYEVLRKIRTFSHVPILVLTARHEESEKVKLLESGANDYISKPFGIKELMVRIKVLLRDIQYAPVMPELRFGELVVQTAQPVITLKGADVNLTKKEHQFLVKLASKPGVLITQQQLLTEIWGPSHVDDSHYLRVLTTQLRKKLQDDPEHPNYIKTEPGLGYTFLAQSE